MSEQSTLTRANLKTPRAAAIAGILFSVLLLGVLWLLRISVPDDPREPGAWLNSASNTVALAINLVPFAGIAFLWFIGGAARPLGRERRQILCNGVLRQRPAVFGDAVCGRRCGGCADYFV